MKDNELKDSLDQLENIIDAITEYSSINKETNSELTKIIKHYENLLESYEESVRVLESENARLITRLMETQIATFY